jgi:hypothetical protein
LYQQTVVKGRAREEQVVDVLEGLLPRGVTVERHVVIVDSKGTQAPAFDGVIYDRMRFPVLYFEKTGIGGESRSTTVALLESVLVCLETKSTLNKHELKDTIQKIHKLESLQSVSSSMRPPVLLFAYNADNMNLSFVDYCAAFASESTVVPNLVCVLNKGLFMAAKKVNSYAVPSLGIEPGSYPVFAQCGNEALLLTYYIVAGLCARSPEVNKILEAHLQQALKDVSLFSFEPEFLAKLSNQGFHAGVRKGFFGKANRPIAEVYRAMGFT